MTVVWKYLEGFLPVFFAGLVSWLLLVNHHESSQVKVEVMLKSNNIYIYSKRRNQTYQRYVILKV